MRGGGQLIEVSELPPPVGSWQHYDFDPRAKWPWTAWDRVAEGTYLVSAGATYQTGKGYGANTHALTEAELPAHRHDLYWYEYKRAYEAAGAAVAHFDSSGDKGQQTTRTLSTGAGAPHNNMPQSIAVPLWHRTS